ncbi:MAG TPA: DNA helicase UvrD [Prevotella sp.]|nr:DNA helicase UvrD [Prevotella sp.]
MAVRQHKPLTVYKASAGSGKTFTLAKEYMKLVIQDPYCYRRILAVTFTNKATEEMKMRILSQLYGISKGLPGSKDYMCKISQELDMKPETVSQNAGKALRNLLHHYNYFRVETIDTFFQSVLRNLARELSLTANLRVELNDRQIEQQAVDTLIEDLDDNDEALHWIEEYISENISDDKGWNIIGQIKRFGENIFKDYYKKNSKDLEAVLSKKDFFSQYTQDLKKLKAQKENQLKAFANKFNEILKEEGLSVNDFAFGEKGACGYFKKLGEGIFEDKKLLTERVKKAQDDPCQWVSKAHQRPNDPIMIAAENKLTPLLKESERQRPGLVKYFMSAKLTLRHLYQLRLLNRIEQKVREMNQEANRFLLSDTQSLLHSMIQASDSPFIYEKMGTELDHIMIDEFQDTSTTQWDNFKILLEECLSRNQESLIVGDVKQSIYRWRSGDWRLLNSIEEKFNQKQLQFESLDTNYRSNRHIIAFNNAFFKEAAHMEFERQKENNPTEAEQLQKAYQDVEQKIPEGREPKGMVHIELLTDDDYQKQTMERMASILGDLIKKGASPKQIAILVRSNRTIQAIANYMMETWPEMPIVSDEAFRLDSSLAVNMIVEGMRVLLHPDNLLAKVELVKAYQVHILRCQEEGNEQLAAKKDYDKLLPTDYTSKRDELLTLPLYELTERLFSIFQLDMLKEQSAYVCAFFDQLNRFLQDNATDIDGFIKEWDDSLCQKTIQSDEVEGIRLLTIHKSKGLEFDHVIMPFCDWKLENQGSLIWCEPKEKPFSRLPIVPIDCYANQIKGTIYEQDYRTESLQNCVDNLNLLYVAFTRASKNLFVLGKRKATGTRSELIEKCLENVKDNLPGSMLHDAGEEESIIFEYGELDTEKKKGKQASQNVFEPIVSPVSIEVKSFDNPVEFRQSNKSKEFTEDDEEEKKQQEYIHTGNVLHQVFSTIRTKADIPHALQQLEEEGILYNDRLSREKLSKMLLGRLENPTVADWFSDQWQLFNECTILKYDKETDEVQEHRPDRVMTNGKEMIVVDFKFGRPREEYKTQVQEYMHLLGEMGYPNVKGYLWYVYTNNIEEVHIK